MSEIHVLDSRVYNKIAAGEVVEKPASVVKELVENSIDAGANDITVEIEEGGTRLIKITDNGSGIKNSEVQNAFLPHATSKLKEAEDLENIQTLGFRGEALSSIAAVSTIEMKTKTSEETLASVMQISGGNLDGISQQSGNTGTIITVKRLFYNTPARLKFLKKPKSEEGDISSLMVKLILANPNIKFHYIVEGKSVYRSNGLGLKEALHAVYPKEIVDNLVEVKYFLNGYKVYGFTSNLNLAKHNRNFQTIILNGRVITNITVATAALNAYGEGLMKKSYPIYVLNITVPNETVDVNVHPSKSEVRFQDNNSVYSLIFQGVRSAIFNINTDSTRQIATANSADAEVESKRTISDFFNAFRDLPQPEFKKKFNQRTDVESNLFRSIENTLKSEAEKNIEEFDEFAKKESNSNIFQDFNSLNLRFKQDFFREEGANYHVIGQIFNTYLLIECDDCMLILDQHAVHERIIYDKLMEKIADKQFSQQQIIPEVVTLSHDEFSTVSEFENAILEIGIEIEQFGPLSYKLTAVPDFLSGLNLEYFLSEICKQVRQMKRIDVGSLLRDEIAKIACKSAIKGNTKLNETQIDMVVSEFIKNKIPLQCPHGRPAMVSMTKNDMEKLFKRKL